MQNVQGKVVVVTGASSGIGEATARHLAGLGAKVVLGARRTERLEAIAEELREGGHAADFVALDVTDLASVRAFVDFAVERHGRIDVIVNNAGVMPLSTLDRLRVDEWNQTIDVNIRGVLHGIAAVLPRFKEQGSGHVVNVSSIAGHRAFPGAAVYCASKFAVGAISEALRQESGDIRVTVVSPGVTESELAQTTTDPEASAWLDAFRKVAIPADAIAHAVAYAISQPDSVDVSEIVVQPTALSA